MLSNVKPRKENRNLANPVRYIVKNGQVRLEKDVIKCTSLSNESAIS